MNVAIYIEKNGTRHLVGSIDADENSDFYGVHHWEVVEAIGGEDKFVTKWCGDSAEYLTTCEVQVGAFIIVVEMKTS